MKILGFRWKRPNSSAASHLLKTLTPAINPCEYVRVKGTGKNNMNKKIKLANFVSAAGLPLILAVSGCQMKNGAADNSATDTNLFIVTNSTVSGTNSNSADNSQNNVRDRNGLNQTPIDQGNSSADIQLTQQIRKLVVNGTNKFSVAAQNIKIITQNGQVTLRGPVENDSEKTTIDGLAKSVAGETNVTDQLEVKTNP